jgi:hypothetical protein
LTKVILGGILLAVDTVSHLGADVPNGDSLLFECGYPRDTPSFFCRRHLTN